MNSLTVSISTEHTVNYNDVADSQPKPLTQRDDPRSSSKVRKTESAGSSDNDVDANDDDEEPKFIDTINPLLSFSNADLADMNQEFDQFFESDTSSDDEPVDIGKSYRLVYPCHIFSLLKFLQRIPRSISN